MKCPCCGHAIDEQKPESGPRLSAIQQVILDTIRNAKGRVPNYELVNKVYTGVRDGGPENARNTICQHIRHINLKTVPYGFKITSGQGRRDGYLIEILK